MGLDQYLKVSKYVSQYDWDREDNRCQKHKAIATQIGLSEDEAEKVDMINVEVCVMYWRKANAIHKWFVDEVQDGEDDCGYYYVPDEKLDELLKACELELQTNGKSGKLHPTSGFFFGSTVKDDFYYEDLERTVKRLKEIKDNPFYKDCSFEYSSSW